MHFKHAHFAQKKNFIFDNEKRKSVVLNKASEKKTNEDEDLIYSHPNVALLDMFFRIVQYFT